jgi:hypothetical protein
MAIYYGDGSNSNSGRVIQVVQDTANASIAGSANNSYNALNNALQLTITPKESDSKILLIGHVSFMGYASRDAQGWSFFKDGSILSAATGDARSNRTRITAAGFLYDNDNTLMLSNAYLDSPNTTSQITYAIRLFSYNNATVGINRSWNDTDNGNHTSNLSSITAMEIAA